MTLYLLLRALGFTLLHFVWQGALIAGLFKMLTLALPKLSPRRHYALGLVALLAMAGAGIITLALEAVRLLGIPAVATAPGGAFDPSALLPWLDAAWLGGVMAMSARMAVGLHRIHRLRALSRPLPDALARRFAATLLRLGFDNRISVRLHPLIDGPFVVGIVRSVIYLPLSALTALSPDQLDAVIAHELEHIRRADYAWNLVQAAIETLFFYHPAVWWLGARIREQRELCCDDAAVDACRDPLLYATALFNLARQRRNVPELAVALGSSTAGPSLAMRVGRILGETPAPMTRRLDPGLWAPMVMTVALLGILVMTKTPVSHVVAVTPPVATRPAPVAAEIEPKPASVKPAARKPLHSPRPAPTPVKTVDPMSMLHEMADSRLVGKEVSGSEVIYFYDGKPRISNLMTLFRKEHVYEKLGDRMLPNGHQSWGAVVALDEGGAATNRYKVVVSALPTENVRTLLKSGAKSVVEIYIRTTPKPPAQPPVTP